MCETILKVSVKTECVFHLMTDQVNVDCATIANR